METAARCNEHKCRYLVLYGSKTCPWAHRAIIFRHLKGLTDHIGLFLVVANDQGYAVDPEGEHLVPGTDVSIKYLHEVLDYQHRHLNFDYQFKAHPSVIEKLYVVPLLPLKKQLKII